MDIIRFHYNLSCIKTISNKHNFHGYIYFREDIITGTTTQDDPPDELKWHTTWECQVLARIAEDAEHQASNGDIDSTIQQEDTQDSPLSNLSKEQDEIRVDAKTTGGLYNLVFPLRFIALKRTSPETYKQLLNLESHLDKRKLQVRSKSILNLTLPGNKINISVHSQ